MILNPNERYSQNSKVKNKKIEEFSTMEKHCRWVWRNILEKKINNESQIFIVAHSMGGACTVEILKNEKKKESIKKIAFTDSVHGQDLKFLIRRKGVSEKLSEVIYILKIFFI